MNESLADKAKQAIDNTLGFGTSDKAEGSAKEALGHGQQAVGEATGDRSLQTKGVGNELAGNTQQAVGEAKTGLQNLGEVVQRGVSNAVENVKDALHDANTPKAH